MKKKVEYREEKVKKKIILPPPPRILNKSLGLNSKTLRHLSLTSRQDLHIKFISKQYALGLV